jgi:hypothetical protein
MHARKTNMSDEKRGLTEQQKNYIVELLSSGKLKSDFHVSYMESMKKCYDKDYSISFKQHNILEELYDNLILGNTERRTIYKFGMVTIVKDDSSHVWQININGKPYGEPTAKGDALSAGLWLSQNIKAIAIDWGIDPDQRLAVEAWTHEEDTPKPPEAEKETVVDDDEAPF